MLVFITTLVLLLPVPRPPSVTTSLPHLSSFSQSSSPPPAWSFPVTQASSCPSSTDDPVVCPQHLCCVHSITVASCLGSLSQPTCPANPNPNWFCSPSSSVNRPLAPVFPSLSYLFQLWSPLHFKPPTWTTLTMSVPDWAESTQGFVICSPDSSEILTEPLPTPLEGGWVATWWITNTRTWTCLQVHSINITWEYHTSIAP